VIVDQETVRDLEIFQTRDGNPGLFQTFDLTRTEGGTAALRFRFENPISSPAHIQQVQAGIRFLISEGLEFDVDPRLISEVRAYLDSSWDTASRARGLRFYLESVVVSLGYRDLFKYARSGVAASQRMFSQIIPFLERIMEKDPPQEIRRPVENLQSLIDRLQLEKIRVTRRPWTIAGADRYLRVQRKADFQRFFELLSDLDALIAMAAATKERNLVLPEVVEGPGFLMDGEGLYHPFLQQPVGNPVNLGHGRNLLFLTGPNMAGKTTYLKAVGVSAFLAHLGMGVPAKEFRFSPLDALFSSLSPEESLREGLSYFMAEVRRVREIAEAVTASDRTLVLFDEVFRGTNVRDALDASQMVISGFARSRNNGFLFSSHLVELAEKLEEESSIHFGFFEGRIEDHQARYEFQLKEGVSQQRFGLQLLEQEGVPELLRSLDEN
jgi:DNA mismatch repair protein MutS